MDILDFLGEGGGDESPRWGSTHLELGVENRGWRLSPTFSRMRVSLNIFLRGSFTSHFMEEHSPPTSVFPISWWRHQIEIFSALLALYAGNSSVTSDFPSERPVNWSFHIFFDLRLNKRLSKQSRRQWIETLSRSLWRQCNLVPNSDPGSRETLRRSTHHSGPIMNW